MSLRAGLNPLVLGWEKAAIGTGLFEPSAMEEAVDLLPADFTGCHQVIWAEMLALRQREGLDVRAVTESLRSRGELDNVASLGDEGLSGEDYLNHLLAFRGSAMAEYADQILNQSLKRELLKVAALIRSDAQDEHVDAQEVMEDAERRLLSLRRNRMTETGTRLGDLISVFNRRVEGFRNGTLKPAWVPKLRPIANIVQYVDKDDFLIIAARPGEGKSSIMRYEFVHAALAGMPALLFNCENGELEYAKFAISMLAGIDSDKLKDPRRLTEEELALIRAKAAELASIPLYVKTIGAPSARQIERIARAHISQHNIRLLGVDYIQLLQNGIESKVLDVSQSSGVLRSIALNYGVPVIANSQMSRSIVHRGQDAEPQLSDLRESGALEQDATMVWFPRSMWPDPTDAQLHTFPENRDVTGRLYPTIKALPIKVYLKKNRNGGTGVTEPMKWIRSTNNFQTLTEVPE